MKKIISLIIVFAMMFTATTGAFASTGSADNHALDQEVKQRGYEKLNISSKEETLIWEDLENGDARFTLMSGEKKISEAYVNRYEQKVIYTDYRSDTPVLTEQKYSSIQKMVNRSLTAKGYTNVGTIKFNLYSQGYIMSSPNINFAYSTNVNLNSTFDLNGQYRDMAEFAGAVSVLLAISAQIGVLVAKKTLALLGIAGTGSFFIPKHEVEAKETKVTWKVTPQNGTTSKYFSGSKYVFDHNGKGTQTEYEGDYYTAQSYSNHDSRLAYRGLHLLYSGGYDNAEIVSW